jgi:RHS repeat-associated protein
VTTRTDPLGRTESYTYDGNGNLLTVTDRTGQVTTRAYDALNRLSQVLDDDNATTTYTYDAANRLTQVVDSVAGTITLAWDALDRLMAETTTHGTLSYTYDPSGRRTGMSAPGQAAISYTYDAADRLTAITQGAATVAFAYDAAHRRTSLTRPNGLVTHYAYDDADRLTGLTYALGTTTLGTLTYGHDASSHRRALGGTWARTGLPAPVTATYNAANHQVSFGGQPLTYDLNGHLTGDGTTTYTWNARHQLTALAGPVPASFLYDPLGRRARKTVDGTTTDFVYDGLNPVAELVGSTTAHLLTGLALDAYFTRTTGTQVQTLLADALGSTIALADDTGAVTTEYTYEPFGGISVTGAASSNDLQYTGREHDGTGLYYYRARYYHPQFQRFISEDPIGFGGGDVNLYAYVGNSPIDLYDPLGLDAWSDAADFTAGFGDTISFGGTAWVRSLWIQQFDLGDVVDHSSGWNLAGRKTAYVYDAVSTAVTGIAIVRALPGLTRGVGHPLLAILRDQRGVIGRFDQNQDALIQIAKRAKDLGGVTQEQVRILRAWAKEYGLRFRGPEMHPERGFGRIPHVHVGPVDHIPVR